MLCYIYIHRIIFIHFPCQIDEWTSVCFARILFMVFINFPCQRAPARGVIEASD